MTSTASIQRDLPQFSMNQVKSLTTELYGLCGNFKALASERDLTWLITTPEGERSVLKISNGNEPEGIVDLQVKAIDHIVAHDEALPIPRMITTRDGKDYDWVTSSLNGQRHMIRMITFMQGDLMEETPEAYCPRYYYNIGAMMGRVAKALQNCFHPYSASNKHLWDINQILQLRPMIDELNDERLRKTCTEILDHAESVVLPRLRKTRCQLVHQDAHGGNVMVDPLDATSPVAILDFGDIGYNSIVCELAVAAESITGNEEDPLAHLMEVAAGFDTTFPLQEEEVDLIYDVYLLRQVMTVIISAYRTIHDREKDSYAEGTRCETMITKLLSVGRTQAVHRIRSALRFPVYSLNEDTDSIPGADFDLLFARRKRNMGDMKHFYNNALHFVRGDGARLYTADGTGYLDAYNNVPQMGHSHPHVVKAIARQAKTLNTNTRYLCDIVAEYAERLTADLPGHLDACIFVNSGSEANDFAMQIARALSGNRGGIVMHDAYHGCTELTAALSPEAYALEDWVETLKIPDDYRGAFAGASDAAHQYAADADRAIADLARRGHQPAAFMIDTALCSNGVISAPDNYFNLVAEKIKAAGGFIIADEVQAGCGRMGTFWGYRANGLHDQQVDMITMGKPVGNAHPLGVVILSRTLLNKFRKNVNNIFSTFGGNTVACAAGMAVLDVIERENLIEKSNRIGDYLRAELRKLADTQLLIGDVRGRGMMTGLEFVSDREAKTPATAETAKLLELMKENQVLTGSEGRDRNVLKLRPSLAWNTADVDFFIEALDQSLSALAR